MAPSINKEGKIEHLQMIQDVISRLASNSFLLKGWTITLVSGLTALSQAEGNYAFALIAAFVVLAFSFLDAYYLALERKYRALYRERLSSPQAEPWKMEVSPPNMQELGKAFTSIPVWLLHGSSLIASSLIAITLY